MNMYRNEYYMYFEDVTVLNCTAYIRGRRGRDRMKVGLQLPMQSVPIACCEFDSRSGRGVQHYVFSVSSGFLQQ